MAVIITVSRETFFVLSQLLISFFVECIPYIICQDCNSFLFLNVNEDFSTENLPHYLVQREIIEVDCRIPAIADIALRICILLPAVQIVLHVSRKYNYLTARSRPSADLGRVDKRGVWQLHLISVPRSVKVLDHARHYAAISYRFEVLEVIYDDSRVANTCSFVLVQVQIDQSKLQFVLRCIYRLLLVNAQVVEPVPLPSFEKEEHFFRMR